MQILAWRDLDEAGRNKALSRPKALLDKNVRQSVSRILKAVRDDGDEALRLFTKKFDGVDIVDLKVPQSNMRSAWRNLSHEDKAAMEMAKGNIEIFHRAQIPGLIEVETMPGVLCRREVRALESVGLYVPGGSAPLVSTVMMLAIPAKIAGVENCVLVTPPSNTGTIDANILAAAHLCGIKDIYILGGAQAIAALGYGTKSIPKCDKIFGPGNAYVAEAKSQISSQMGGPAIDLPAGPSEAMVLADDLANPIFVASDLLSQAEHDPMAQVVCVCMSQKFADKLSGEIKLQISSLPRKEIAIQSLENGRILIVPNVDAMVEIANTYAPEHLIIQLKEPETIVSNIRNAGSIFLGPWTPESVGDYASGTNHTLPTFGAARSYSGVCVESFMKFISVQSLTREGLEALGPCVERLALMEGLEAHRRAISLRLSNGVQI
ncbi:MAG: histidinol dehydrogenase [Robiginitomaculum sp.]